MLFCRLPIWLARLVSAVACGVMGEDIKVISGVVVGR
jgi:hypothetical protein